MGPGPPRPAAGLGRHLRDAPWRRWPGRGAAWCLEVRVPRRDGLRPTSRPATVGGPPRFATAGSRHTRPRTFPPSLKRPGVARPTRPRRSRPQRRRSPHAERTAIRRPRRTDRGRPDRSRDSRPRRTARSRSWARARNHACHRVFAGGGSGMAHRLRVDTHPSAGSPRHGFASPRHARSAIWLLPDRPVAQRSFWDAADATMQPWRCRAPDHDPRQRGTMSCAAQQRRRRLRSKTRSQGTRSRPAPAGHDRCAAQQRRRRLRSKKGKTC